MARGPTKGELRFRLAFSLAGLALTAAAVVARGWPPAPALVEVIGIAGLFFGGTAIWSARKLWSADDDASGPGKDDHGS